MSRPPKVFRHNDVLFVTTSVEQGLLLPANALMNLIVLCCLAHAQVLHPVRISAFIVEGTHIHMLLVVINPEDVSDFMERFKTETAHAINSLLGRRGRTVWCEGFDSPVLVNVEDVVRKLVYLYANPVKDGLVPQVAEYPGLSSFSVFSAREGTQSFTAPRLLRPAVKALPRGKRLRARHFQKIAEELTEGASSFESCTVEPAAWMDAFQIPSEERAGLTEELLSQIAASERDYRQVRTLAKKGYIGAERLADGGFDLNYESPSRQGRRMLCICANREDRRRFIKWVQTLRAEGREVLRRWREGDFSVPYPAGLFPPSLPRRWNLVPSLTW